MTFERVNKYSPGGNDRGVAVYAFGGKDRRSPSRFAALANHVLVCNSPRGVAVISVKGRVSRNRDGNLRVCPSVPPPPSGIAVSRYLM